MIDDKGPPGLADPSSGPIEYKDAPIRFTFFIDDREEPIRIVEPQLDLPFPDNALLRVEEGEKRLCEVVFHFDMDAAQPYRLAMKEPDRQGQWKTVRLAYGDGVAPESEMTSVYRKTILDRGNVQARIEMTRRKARLQIDYRPGRRVPPPAVP